MRVSVIILCHNLAPYIEESINSVISQTNYENIFEIIIVNDGSTDNSLHILNKLKLSCNKIKIITTKGVGLASARNIGIKASLSEFVAFLDGDDFWTKDKLQNQLKFFHKDLTIGLIYGDYWDFTKFDASDAKLIPVRSLNKFNDKQLIEYFIKDAPIVPSTTICRKKVFETVGLFNEKLKKQDDTDMFLRIAEKWKLFYVKGGHCYKRRSKNQITERLENLLYEQNMTAKNAILRNPQLKKYEKKRKSIRLLKAAVDCLIMHKERKSAFSHVTNSIKYDLFNIRAWLLIIMLLIPYKLNFLIFNFIKDKFYQLRIKQTK